MIIGPKLDRVNISTESWFLEAGFCRICRILTDTLSFNVNFVQLFLPVCDQTGRRVRMTNCVCIGRAGLNLACQSSFVGSSGMYRFLRLCLRGLYISDRYLTRFYNLHIRFLAQFLLNEIAAFCIGIN